MSSQSHVSYCRVLSPGEFNAKLHFYVGLYMLYYDVSTSQYEDGLFLGYLWYLS